MSFSDFTTLSLQEKQKMTLVEAFKGGELWRSFDTLYFQHPSQDTVHRYSDIYLDYILEWGRTDLRLDEKQKDLITGTGIANNIPVRCTFKNGLTSDYCFLQLTHLPPSADYFADNHKPKWHYLNEVTALAISPRSVTKEVLEAMKKMEQKSAEILAKIMKLKGNLLENPEYAKIKKNPDLVVTDDKGRLFKFHNKEEILYQEYIEPQTFKIVENPSEQQLDQAEQLSYSRDVDERRDWKPDFRDIYIVADAE